MQEGNEKHGVSVTLSCWTRFFKHDDNIFLKAVPTFLFQIHILTIENRNPLWNLFFLKNP